MNEKYSVEDMPQIELPKTVTDERVLNAYKETGFRMFNEELATTLNNSIINDATLNIEKYTKIYNRNYEYSNIYVNLDYNLIKNMYNIDYYRYHEFNTEIIDQSTNKPILVKSNSKNVLLYRPTYINEDFRIPDNEIQLLLALHDKHIINKTSDVTPKISLGGDPEFLIYDESNDMIDACSIISDYHNRRRVGLDGCSDILEMRPTARLTPKGYVKSVEKCMKEAKSLIDANKYTLNSGCGNESYSIGGHIHIGNIVYSSYLIKLLDHYVLTPLRWCSDSRRLGGSSYEGESKWRIQPHGVEYRSPVSFYSDPETVEAIYNMVYDIATHVINISTYDKDKIKPFTPSDKTIKLFNDAKIFHGTNKSLKSNVFNTWNNKPNEFIKSIIAINTRGEIHDDTWYKLPEVENIKNMYNKFIPNSIIIVYVYGSNIYMDGTITNIDTNKEKIINIIGRDTNMVEYIKQYINNTISHKYEPYTLQAITSQSSIYEYNNNPISIGLTKDFRSWTKCREIVNDILQQIQKYNVLQIKYDMFEYITNKRGV